MANKENDTHQHNNSSAKEWQEYMESRIQENIMSVAPTVLESLGIKITPPTMKSRLKTVGAALGIAVVGGVVGASTVIYLQNRKARKMGAVEFDKDVNGQSRVRPVGSRAQTLVA